MKSLLLILLCALTAASAAACAGEGASSVTDAATVSETEVLTDEILPELPDADYKGYEFKMYMRNDDVFIADMYAAEANGDVMNDAIFNRNSAVSERFNIVYAVINASDSLGRGAEKTIMAGDDAYDVVIPHGRASFRYGQLGLALEWNTGLPYVDMDKPWWDTGAREQFTLNGKLYEMIGDISYLSFGRTMAMLYNKSIFAQYGIDPLYDMVKAGDWTFDEFARIAKATAGDVNGDSVIDTEKDRLGYVTSIWYGPSEALYAAGQRVCVLNGNKEMELSLNNTRTVKAYEKYFGLTDSEVAFIQLDGDLKIVTNIFRDGRSAFMDVLINDITNLRDMDDDFGIIPWPKLDADIDKYYSTAGAGSNMLVVPVTAANPERTSVILEALCYEGYKNVLPLYYEIVVQYKFSRDTESIDMLELIYAGRTYDIGFFYDGGVFTSPFNSIGQNLAKDESHNFTSFYAKYEAQALELIESINEAYR